MTEGADLLQLLSGTAAVVAVAWLPGLLLLLALRPSAGWLRNIALAPVVSLGLLMSWGLALNALGWAVRPATVLPVALGAPAVALCLALARNKRLLVRSADSTRPAVGWADGAVLGLATLLPLGMWLRASRLAALVPPNDDGTHHGLFTQRVLQLGTLQPDRVAVGDVFTDQPSTAFYPLAMHLAAALASGVSGVATGTTIDMLVIGLAAVALPLGVFVLSRRLFPTDPHAAPAAALVAVALPAFPYYPSSWGGLTMIAAIAVVPAVIDAMAGIAEDARLLTGGLLLGLAWAGLFTLHVTELVTVALIAIPLVLLPRWPAGALVHFRDLATRWLIGSVVVGAVIAVQFGQFLEDADQREEVARLLPRDSDQALHDVTATFLGTDSTARTVLSALFVIGVVFSLSRRRSTGWLLAALFFAWLTYVSSMRTGLGDLLATPWYGRWDRVVINELFFVATYAGLGAAALIRAVQAVARRARLPQWAAAAAAAGTAVGLAVLALLPEYQASARQVSHSFDSASLAGPQERAAFAWLAAHTRPGERVLNDITDGSGWMYPLADVPPVFAMATHAYPEPAWGDRIYLRAHVGQVDSNARARQAADAWHVRYVYVGPRLFPGRRPLLDLAALQSSAAWHVVYRSGGAMIFERVRPV